MADEKEMAGVPEGQKQGWGQFLSVYARWRSDRVGMPIGCTFRLTYILVLDL